MKRSILFVLFFVIGLASATFAQEVQTGSFGANGDSPGYTLNKESGDRTYTIEVNYPQPFNKKPSIILSVSLIDADKNQNLRYEVQASAVSRDGFMIKIKTWADTKINGIGGNWMAVAN